MTTPGIYIGIDVAKDALVVATADRLIGSFPNDDSGHRALVERLRSFTVTAVVLESTGPYGRGVALALMAARFSVSVVPPARVRCYARSLGIRAKTDPIDAQVIARFAAATSPRPLVPPSAEITRLRALVDRRAQVIALRVQEQSHEEACGDAVVARELARSIARLKQIEKDYTTAIAKHLRECAQLAWLAEALQEEVGVGLQTTATLLAHLPEIGRLNRQSVAAIAGLAPFNRDSGNQEGKRSIGGGRARVRRALHMAVVSAVRRNDWISTFYRTLRERGKPAKVALVACARKLLVRLNSLAAKAICARAPAAVEHAPSPS